MLSLEPRRWRAIFLMAFFTLPGRCRIEDRVIFQPTSIALKNRSLNSRPESRGVPATPDGVRLHGWYIPRSEARSTLVWFHGNAGSISHRRDNIKLLHDKVAVNIFIFDYRGYGRSEGGASEEGTYLDGEAALELVGKQLGTEPSKTVLFGRSLGAAVVAEMAKRHIVQAVILESPFVSIAAMARVTLPFLPIAPFLKTRYDIRAKIQSVKAPILVLHGDRDEVVPFAQGKSVFDAAPEPKIFLP
jgi:uncharacterized protein